LWADLRENMGRSFGTQNLLFLLPRIEILGYDLGRGAASFLDWSLCLSKEGEDVSFGNLQMQSSSRMKHFIYTEPWARLI